MGGTYRDGWGTAHVRSPDRRSLTRPYDRRLRCCCRRGRGRTRRSSARRSAREIRAAPLSVPPAASGGLVEAVDGSPVGAHERDVAPRCGVAAFRSRSPSLPVRPKSAACLSLRARLDSRAAPSVLPVEALRSSRSREVEADVLDDPATAASGRPPRCCCRRRRARTPRSSARGSACGGPAGRCPCRRPRSPPRRSGRRSRGRRTRRRRGRRRRGRAARRRSSSPPSPKPRNSPTSKPASTRAARAPSRRSASPPRVGDVHGRVVDHLRSSRRRYSRRP